MDYRQGILMYDRMRGRPELVKEQVMGWILQIAELLENHHKCERQEGYGYVNPYGFLITEKDEIYLVDMSDESNEEIKKRAERRQNWSYFLPEGKVIGQKKDIENDIYGFGKIIQFLFAQTDIYPALSKAEEYAYLKMVHRCTGENSKRTFQNFEQIRQKIPQIKRKKKILSLLFAGSLCTAALIGGLGNALARIGTEEKKEVRMKNVVKASEEDAEDDNIEIWRQQDEIYMEAGLVYFLELADYAKALEYFEKVSEAHEQGRQYRMLCRYLLGKEHKEEKEIGKVLQELEESKEALKLQYMQSRIRIYAGFEKEDYKEKIIELGEKILSAAELKSTDQEHFREEEVRTYLEHAYEAKNQMEKVLEQYQEMEKKDISFERKREWMYRWAEYLAEHGDLIGAKGICEKGIGTYGGSEKLCMIHLELLCRQPDIQKEEVIQKAKQYNMLFPGILESEDYIKIKEIYQL